jgi:UDP-N-acetylglucosamine 2-epimerase (non-hydrolysing)
MLDNPLKTVRNIGENLSSSEDKRIRVLVLFGTRPEAIKLAPVINELKKHTHFRTTVVSSSQHTDLLTPFLEIFKIKTDYDLQVMTANQTPNQVCSKVLSALDSILDAEKPDVILVQGDTTTAFAGAFAGFNRKIKVGHVEAGLRSGNPLSPFPEEMNRRLISQVAAFHFAATDENRKNILQETADSDNIFVVGNTVVDALHFILEKSTPSEKISQLIKRTKGLKSVLLTTHRRESFGKAMSGNLRELRNFVERNKDICLFFPVHPNPNVQDITNEILADRERIYLLEPLNYADFVTLMKEAWLIVSDSGGVQEEAPSLGKPLLVLRENTERPEALRSGVAKLVGGDSEVLAEMLEENYKNEKWINSVKEIKNPFGDGTSAQKIVEILEEKLTATVKNQQGEQK